MNNEPVAWMNIHGQFNKKETWLFPIPLYTHPVKELNAAIKIIKDFQSDDVPPCKSYEDTYADGWMDACNEILWAIEEKAQEK